MSDRIIRFALRNRALVLVLTGLLVAVGIASLRRLTIDAVPDITTVQVQVLTSAPALGPLEIEQSVTYAVETSLSGLPGVEELRSVSRYGISSVTVVFEDGTSLWFARQLVQERLADAKERIPPGAGTPEMAPPSTGLGEIYHFVLDGPGYSPMELRTILEWQVAYRLRQVPGVVEVNPWGGLAKQFQVLVDPNRLRTYGLSLAELFEAIEKGNGLAGSAYIEKRQEQILIRGEGMIANIRDLESVVVEAREGGTPVKVGDLARVVEGGMPRRGAATHDGKGEAVIAIVQMLAGENSRLVTERVKIAVERIQHDLPPGVRIRPYYDRTELIERTIRTVATNLTEGGLIVIAVLLLFLGNLRGGLIVAAAIPLAMLVAFTGMVQAGISGNLMSLGAIDFGLIVDGSVVMVENILRVLGKTQDPTESVRDRVLRASIEVGRPVVFAVGIIIIVYLPILTLSGTEGKMFRPMAWTVVFALLGSLLLALTLVPVLCSFAFRLGAREHATWLVRAARAAYAPSLSWALAHRAVVLGGAVVAVVLGLALVPLLGGEFVPKLDEGDLVIQGWRPASVSMTQSVAASLDVERVLRTFPEVKTVVTRIGTAEVATDVMGIELGEVFAILRPRAEWRSTKSKEELVEKIHDALEERVPGSGFTFTQPIEMRFNELIAGVKSDVALRIYGDDLDTLRRLADDTASILAKIHGAKDIRPEQVQGLPVLRIVFDRQKLARYGIKMRDALGVVEAIHAGTVAGTVVDGVRRFEIALRFDLPQEPDLEAIGSLPVMDSSGSFVTIAQIADVRLEEGPAQISRRSGQRVVTVECNVRGRDIEGFVTEAKARLGRELTRPEGYYLEWGGAFEQLERGKERLFLVVPAALLLILFLLYGAFGSFRLALVVFTGIPLAAVGGIVALLVRGIPFSISAGVGFIALFGVAVLNGVVLVSAINRLRSDGQPVESAVRDGAMARLRPVLTTALVASLGFIPMAFSHSAGAEVQRPLATVVIGGLISSTLLTLLVLPVLYTGFGRGQRGDEVI